MIFRKIRIHIFSFIYILLLSSIAFPQMQDVAKIKVEDKSISIQQGENFSINVSITVDATWHINSNKPNDSLQKNHYPLSFLRLRRRYYG